MINIALPKGRLGEKVYGIFEKIGFKENRAHFLTIPCKCF